MHISLIMLHSKEKSTHARRFDAHRVCSDICFDRESTTTIAGLADLHPSSPRSSLAHTNATSSCRSIHCNARSVGIDWVCRNRFHQCDPYNHACWFVCDGSNRTNILANRSLRNQDSVVASTRNNRRWKSPTHPSPVAQCSWIIPPHVGSAR